MGRMRFFDGPDTVRRARQCLDENGFTLSSVPKGWVAVFGFYGLSQRTPDLVPAQVVLLQQLLHQAGEDTVGMVILADATDGTYIPRTSPAPPAKPSKAP